MNYCLAQLILAARSRNSDNGGWIQILVFAVIAIVYGISYIIKTKANKLEEQQQGQGKPDAGRRPGQKAYPTAQRPVSKTAQTQPRRPIQAAYREIARPQPAAENKMPEIQLQRPEVKQVLARPEELALVGEPLAGIKGLEATDLKVTQPRAIIEQKPLFDFDDPDSLRRAILHYEILGKPLSLRGLTE